MLKNKLVFSEKKDILTELKKERLPLFIYGGSNLAESVLSLLEKHNISTVGVFVDDAFFVQGQQIRGMCLKKLKDIEEKYDKFSIIMGMSRMDKGYSLQKSHPKIVNVYAIPNLSIVPEERLSKEYYLTHEAEYETFYHKLADNHSKECLIRWIEASVSGDITKIFPYYNEGDTYFSTDIHCVRRNETYLDVGAFYGDTIRGYMDVVGKDFKKIWAIEGDQAIYESLKQKVHMWEIQDKTELFSCIIWEKENMPVNYARETRAGSVGKVVLSEKEATEQKDATSYTTTIDSLLKNREYKIDFMKINFRKQAYILRGCTHTIQKDLPSIAIKIGYEPREIYHIMKQLEQLNPNYSFYVRFIGCRPEELTLYAI